MTQPVRFYTDEHVGRAVARGLRRQGVDVQTAPEAGLIGASDDEHLEHARSEGRVLFTQDDDFLQLHASGVAHAGIAYVRQQTPIGEIIRGLKLIHDALDAKEMVGKVEFL